MPLQSRAVQDGRGDFLNRAAGRIDGGDALSRHELLGLAHLVATERRIAAAGPPRLADLLQSLCIDGQAEQAVAQWHDDAGSLRSTKSSGGNGILAASTPNCSAR
jgi:hypothetical protein